MSETILQVAFAQGRASQHLSQNQQLLLRAGQTIQAYVLTRCQNQQTPLFPYHQAFSAFWTRFDYRRYEDFLGFPSFLHLKKNNFVLFPNDWIAPEENGHNHVAELNHHPATWKQQQKRYLPSVLDLTGDKIPSSLPDNATQVPLQSEVLSDD